MFQSIRVTMVWLVVCLSLSVQAIAAEDLGKVIDGLGVPASPAFTALGVTPEKIIRPGNARDLALAILQGVDENGNFQNGLAIDSAWYLPLLGTKETKRDYIENPEGFNSTRFLSRMNISIGASKGSSDNDKSTRVSVGIRQVIFDYGDPRLDTELTQCIDQAHTLVFENQLPPDVVNDPIKLAVANAEREKKAEAIIKPCREASVKKNFGKPAMDIGVSPVWISDDGQTKNLEWQGISTWVSIQATLSNVLFIGNVQYKSKDTQKQGDGSLLEGQSISAGLKARYGSPSFGVLAQGVYTYFDPSVGKKEDQFLYSVGGEIKLAEKLWVEASVGGTSGKENKDSGFVSGQFKWSFSEASKY